MSTLKSLTLIFLFLQFFPILKIGHAQPLLKIGIIGDQTGSYNLDESYQIMQQAVTKLARHKPDVILHVGDMVESVSGIKDYSSYQQNFERAVHIMQQLPCPWYVTAGDHDVVPPVFKPASEDHSRLKWFQDLSCAIGLPMKDHLYYSFDVRGYHFISLFSLESLHTDPRWGPIFLNHFSQAQVDWLKKDLFAHRKAKGIVVFLHQPHWYVWSNWYEIHQILREYPVAGVIAGHYHYDQDDGVIDGIHYVVIGSTGGVVKNTDAHSGGSQQYALLSLKGNRFVDIQLFEVFTDSLLEFTPRRSMDRMQTLSYMIDNLYMDETIYQKNGSLMYKVAEGKYDTLHFIGLESLANPIDLPISIQVSALDSDLINPRWSDSNDKPENQSPFVLQPGERIGWANYSNVGNWQQLPPLWVTDIGNTNRWLDKKQVSLKVQVSFTDQRKRWIESTVNFPIHSMP